VSSVHSFRPIYTRLHLNKGVYKGIYHSLRSSGRQYLKSSRPFQQSPQLNLIIIKTAIMHYSSLLTLLTLAITASATLNPATSNTKGKKPTNLACSATKVSKAIQAAECSHNTRTSKTQTFAVFITDHRYDSSHGAPYGTCSAYTCAVPTTFETNADAWTFFWDSSGEDSGYGTTCIKSPKDGACGCENSDGTFVAGSSSCT
jgi:hypothetical protein